MLHCHLHAIDNGLNVLVGLVQSPGQCFCLGLAAQEGGKKSKGSTALPQGCRKTPGRTAGVAIMVKVIVALLS